MDWEAVARAHAHPLRIRILKAPEEAAPEPLSPARFSEAAGASVNVAAYHFKMLAAAGLIQAAGTTTEHRGVEHLYRLAGG